MSQWRPIETAPASPALLLCARNGTVVIGQWPMSKLTDDEREELARMGVKVDGWEAAYWMPVPMPPAELTTSEPAWARALSAPQ